MSKSHNGFSFNTSAHNPLPNKALFGRHTGEKNDGANQRDARALG